MENLGFLAAFGAALAWGSYAVPFKKSRSERLIQFQALMGVGIFFSGLILSLILGYPLSLNIYGLISGVMWAIANAISLYAILNLGISKAVPLIISLVIFSSFLWGTLVFKEISQGLGVAFFGIGLILLGVVLVSTTESSQSRNAKKGFLTAVLAGLIYGSQLVPLKIGDLTTQQFFFPSCVGIFVAAMLIALLTNTKFKKEAIKESLLSGIIWNFGNLLSVIAISMIGLAKGQPLSLSAILVAVLWGLFYFKEGVSKRQKIQILSGAIILLIGVITLGLA